MTEQWKPWVNPGQKHPTRRRQNHSPVHVALGKHSTNQWPYQFCRACGMVYLKNSASQAAARGPCDAMDEVL